MLDKQRENQYRKFKDTHSNNNNNEHDQDLDRSRLFINEIKDHRHDKIKAKHIEKFKKLYFKCYGCHYHLSRHTNYSNNIDNDPNTLSRKPNVPSSISNPSTTATTSTSIPTIPMAPIPSISTMDINPAPRLPPSSTSHACTDHTDKWVINLSKNPPYQGTIIPPTKRTQFCHHS